MKAIGDGDIEVVNRSRSFLGASSLRTADIISSPFSLSDSSNHTDRSSLTKSSSQLITQFPDSSCERTAALLPLNKRGSNHRPPLKSPSFHHIPPQEGLSSRKPSSACITRSHSIPQSSPSYRLHRPPSLIHSFPQPAPRVSDTSSESSKCSKMPSPKNVSMLSHSLIEDAARAISDPSRKPKLSVDVVSELVQAPHIITRQFASQPPSPSASIDGGVEQNSIKYSSGRVNLKGKRHRRSYSDNLFLLDFEIPYSVLQSSSGELDAQIVREIELEKQEKTIHNGELTWKMDSSGYNLETLSVLHEQKADEKDRKSVENSRGGDGGDDLFSMYIDMEDIDDSIEAKDEEKQTDVCKQGPIRGGWLDSPDTGFEDLHNMNAIEDGKLDIKKNCQLQCSTDEDSKVKLSPGGVQDQPAGKPQIAGEHFNLAVCQKTKVESGGFYHVRNTSMGSLVGCGDKGTENRILGHSQNNSVDGCTSLKRDLLNEDADNGTKKVMENDKLAELALVDPKRAKRILANRQSAARSKERKVRYITELEEKVQVLRTEATSFSTQLTSLQRGLVALLNENNELKLRLHAMEQQAQLRDALNNALCVEVQHLKVEKHQRSGVAGNLVSIDEQLFQGHQALQMQQHHLSKPALAQFPTLNFVQNLFSPLQALGGAFAGQLLKADLPSVVVSPDHTGPL